MHRIRVVDCQGKQSLIPIEPTVHEKYAGDDLLLALDDIAADKQCFRAGDTGLIRVCPSFRIGEIAADFGCLIPGCFDCLLICYYSAVYTV